MLSVHVLYPRTLCELSLLTIGLMDYYRTISDGLTDYGKGSDTAL